jgi:hypothetical protein
MGDFIQRGQSFDEALEEARDIGDMWGEATIIWKRAETELKKPAAERNRDQLLADFATATDSFEAMSGRPFTARVIRDGGQALVELGEVAEGQAKLREALTQLDALGIKTEADQLRALASAASRADGEHDYPSVCDTETGGSAGPRRGEG